MGKKRDAAIARKLKIQRNKIDKAARDRFMQHVRFRIMELNEWYEFKVLGEQEEQ